MGVAPDAIRATPEFREANARFQEAFARLRAFNTTLAYAGGRPKFARCRARLRRGDFPTTPLISRSRSAFDFACDLAVDALAVDFAAARGASRYFLGRRSS